MADYYPVIVRAASSLASNTPEGRQALYNRARRALTAELQRYQPALSMLTIAREMQALEMAIREAEARLSAKLATEPIKFV